MIQTLSVYAGMGLSWHVHVNDLSRVSHPSRVGGRTLASRLQMDTPVHRVLVILSPDNRSHNTHVHTHTLGEACSCPDSVLHPSNRLAALRCESLPV